MKSKVKSLMERVSQRECGIKLGGPRICISQSRDIKMYIITPASS